jgi:hypothetical protein
MGRRIKRVRLEFLRHGPQHNQLLSPLTRYLALCDNYSSETVSVPYEHREFLARNWYLNYKDRLTPAGGAVTAAAQALQQQARNDADGHRKLQLDLIAKELSEFLGRVPGLAARLVDEEGVGDMVHLEMVLSASEMALLPFELALSPSGCPGEGKPLTLQNDAPICMTRRSRRVSPENLPWPGRAPRILFVAAAPNGATIPFQAHLHAVRQAVDPWIRASTEKSATVRMADLLTVLPQASVKEIADEMRRRPYTHVHILAHGVRIKNAFDERYGLRLHAHNNKNQAEDLTGSQLAIALTPENQCRKNGAVIPSVVSLASCYGGSQGGVIGAGSSLAHELHDNNVPFVVSSQYPLSFKASVILVSTLYQGLLWGEDPRVILNVLRRQLHTMLPDTHDWASLLAYSALPKNLDFQLKRNRFDQAKSCIEAGFSYHEMAFSNGLTTPVKKWFDRAWQSLEKAKIRLDDLLEDDHTNDERRARIHGLIGSTEKRESQMTYSLLQQKKVTDPWCHEGFRAHLKRARAHYQSAFRYNRYNSWALIQELTLTGLLVDYLDEGTEVLASKWYLAKSLLHQDVESQDPERIECAHSNLIELFQLKLLLNVPFPVKGYATIQKEISQQTTRLIKARVEGSYEMRSRIRHLNLMSKWSEQLLDDLRNGAKPEDVPGGNVEAFQTRIQKYKAFGDKACKQLKDAI